jgi:hypothetical protein
MTDRERVHRAPISALMVGAFLLMLAASIGLAYIGAKPRRSADEQYLNPKAQTLKWGTFGLGLAISSLWLVPLYFVTLGRPRLRITDDAIALTRRARTTTIRFAEVTLARKEQQAVGISFFGRDADTRQFRVQSATAFIIVEGPLADAAGAEFETAWLAIMDVVKAREADA